MKGKIYIKTELHLDAKDIAKIIANYFGTNSKDVSIFVQKEISGYGFKWKYVEKSSTLQ